jgi:hypothetical protein
MRSCWTYSSFLSLLFILSYLDSGICLDNQQIQVMKSLFNLSSSWKNANSGNPCEWGGVNCTADGSSVIELHMSSFGLKGNAWQTVCQLQALQVLDVSNNFCQPHLIMISRLAPAWFPLTSAPILCRLPSFACTDAQTAVPGCLSQ